MILGVLAALSLYLSQWPRAGLPVMMPAVLLMGVVQARRWLRAAPQSWLLDREKERIERNGVMLAQVRVEWRCGLAVVTWRASGSWRRHCQVLLPWRLSIEVIRELRQWPRWRKDSTVRPELAP